MADFILATTLEQRLRGAVSAAWHAFSRKVGAGLVPINKEASMQLQLAYLMQQLLPLTIQNKGEEAELELETGVRTSTGANNIDILVKGGRRGEKPFRLAVELKCYRQITSGGGKRGAQDIFMHDVYADLGVLDLYQREGFADQGVALVMNDYRALVYPTSKLGKAWESYDISHGARCRPGVITTPVGGRPRRVQLDKHYAFDWQQYGGYWFLEVEGMPAPLASHNPGVLPAAAATPPTTSVPPSFTSITGGDGGSSG